ncbi:glutathione S-transferase [Sphingomonas sp. 4RDLI-65]|uniref:glutathione S-transferase n=1 Tax=Sphingomonas sp. 4RDLI-65 TaxID=3111641 RepID=UPI003C1A3521
MLPILYSFRRCPYAMRARLAVLANGVRVAMREVSLRDKPAAMLEASPKGTVPVLVLPDGTVIDQSLEIMRWTLPPADRALWPNETAAALVSVNDGAFKHHLDRYKYADRYGVDGHHHRDIATEILKRLDAALGRDGKLGGALGDAAGSAAESMTDLAIMPFVRQFAETDRSYFDALPFPALQAWLARHLESAPFARVMLRPAPWQPGDVPILFPPLATPGDLVPDPVAAGSGG